MDAPQIIISCMSEVTDRCSNDVPPEAKYLDMLVCTLGLGVDHKDTVCIFVVNTSTKLFLQDCRKRHLQSRKSSSKCALGTVSAPALLPPPPLQRLQQDGTGLQLRYQQCLGHTCLWRWVLWSKKPTTPANGHRKQPFSWKGTSVYYRIL